MIFPQGGELFSISKPGFHIFTFSIDEEALVLAAERRGVPEIAEILNSGVELLSVEAWQLADLVSECRALADAARDDPAAAVSHNRIVTQLIAVLMEAGAHRPLLPRSQLRSQAIRRAREAILDQRNLPLTVDRLCREAGVSVRTLQYAFSEEFSMTPKAWLMARSLNQVRRQLQRRRSGKIKIADVANDWGFWHMGQFAKDYRRMFSELPSKTLGSGD